MSTKHESHGLTANPSKDAPSDRVRDVREDAQNDDTDEQANNPPNHGLPTHSSARFLWECPKDTPISELGEAYKKWQGGEQSDLTRWSE
ncbi:hypothetical protein [Haloarcula sp. JP-L23]|uniref:hypothetical protein n=1 Tax=Haloarcula sp. JP-L23 TaxID=2716717 RepID=UPI00140F339A|nr:hypothetical protein G9465_08620 [Haloarcula sp. JP-L23]